MSIAQDIPAARLDWIDVLKGCGIILVVCGHVLDAPTTVRFIYFFHMPLFFCVSGYLFRPRAGRALLPKLLRGLAVPYVAFIVLITLLDLIQSRWTGHSTSLPLGSPLKAVALAIYGGSKLSAAYAVFWFLPCLGLSTFVMNVVLCRSNYNPLSWQCVVIFTLMAAIGYGIGPFALPLGANIVPMAATIMWIGFVLRSLDANIGHNRMVQLICFVTGIFGSVLFTPMNMKNGVYGTLIWTLLTSIALIIALALTIRNFPLPMLAASFLSSLGRASLVIMFLHQVVNVALGASVLGWNKALFCVLLPYGFYLVIKKFQSTQRIFLGGR